jgi:tetratricopeptide (TPR) repeat protein
MASIHNVKVFVIFVAVVALPPSVRASDLSDGGKINTSIVWKKSRKSPDLSREFVQTSRDFSLLRNGKKVSPIYVGLIYRKERADGDRLVLSERSQGLEGWVPASSVVAMTKAEAFFSQAIRQHPNDSFAFLMRGIVRNESDDTDQAFADLNQALRLDPMNVAALCTRCILWEVKNRPDQALADINKALEIDAQNSDVLARRGLVFADAKENDKALADFQRAIELGSQSVMIYVSRGLIHLERRELSDAQADFEHAQQIDSERADALVGLGMVQTLQSQVDEAIRTLNKAIHLDPRAGEAYGLRGMLFRVRGDDKKALADLDEAIRLNPKQAPHVHNHGLVMYGRAEFDSALADVEKAIRLDPNDPNPQQGRAWILTACPVPRIRNGEQAVVSATRACELTKWSESRYLATLAAAYSEKGDFASAVYWQEQAIGNLDLRNSGAGVYHPLLACYKSKKPYRAVGAWQGMWLRTQ